MRSPMWYAQGLQCQNRNLQSRFSQHPKERKESYLDRRRPSISNFSQFIRQLKSKRTMMSGINQMLTPHIQDRDSRTFLPAQICLLSCWRSLAADPNPSLVACANIRQLEDCAGAMQGEQNVGKQHVKTPVRQPASLQIHSHKCAKEVLLLTAPELRLFHSLCVTVLGIIL